MSNSVIQRELTALVQEKKLLSFPLSSTHSYNRCNGSYWIYVYKITYTCQ